MRRRFEALVCGLLVLQVTAGCSLFGSRWQTVSVASDPPGAQVLIDGAAVGTTPLRHEVRRRDPVAIMVRKPGYKTEVRTTHVSVSPLGIADMIGGCVILLPFIGLLSGAAWEQRPSSVSVVLERESKLSAR